MTREGDLLDMLGRVADPRLLDEGAGAEFLPPDIARPSLPAPDRRHDRIVGVGAALTGVTLVGGVLLALAGVADAVAGGGALALVALVLGVILAATHWGWVHVAEITATRMDEGRAQLLDAGRDDWLRGVAPYPRFTVTTAVRDDGSIVIQRIAHRPAPVGRDRFTFTRTVETTEVHSGEESGVTVAERAEELRHRAEADTHGERARYEAAAAALAEAQAAHADAAERLAVVKAASQALSDRLNARLKEPGAPPE